ncbi:hypothetical protein SAMN05216344_102211 [Polaromonas sp. OV174]|uniref:hypothetical protein n=1 Tax=Polaromonas sp. OV174 TaxID=1855300 RepID=UPI0008F269BA|nr:hypothetical protein [Polaromonas sp. OV174]SFB74652.1 hypothetical protein SAMN05216344_102211 [Polaromonas sp. OV174]
MGKQDLPIDMIEAAQTDTPIGQASLALVQNTLTEFNKVEAGLAALRTKYKDVAYPVATVAGMAEAKAARIAIREPRYAVDKAAKAAKDPLNQLKRDIDARALEITTQLLALETPVHEQIRVEEERKEAEKAAKAEADRLKAQAAQLALDDIRNTAVQAVGKPAADIAWTIETLEGQELSIDVFGDRAGEAMQAKAQALATLNSLHASAVAQEAENLRMAAERAELEALRNAQAERDREAAAAREAADLADKARREQEQRAEAEKLAADRAAFAKEQAEARATQQAEAEKLADARRELNRAQDAEQKRLNDIAAAERAEAERIAQAQRDQDARTAEAARLEAQRIEREAGEAKYALIMAEAAARTKLQEAAPALLAALKDCLAFIEKDCQGGDAGPEITNARAAIALATE